MIHKEGFKISLGLFIILAAINVVMFILSGPGLKLWISIFISAGLLTFILRFFRNPDRKADFKEGHIYSPADGKVVVVEEATENEYLGDKRIQVSIFMSVWNVHINWFPFEGNITYYKYHPGKYLIARNPKSSTDNERNTTAIRTSTGTEIVLRQIAGYVARRIISYSSENMPVKAGDEMGFIRFGSRVDLFLPADAEILVSPGDRVKGLKSVIARF